MFVVAINGRSSRTHLTAVSCRLNHISQNSVCTFHIRSQVIHYKRAVLKPVISLLVLEAIAFSPKFLSSPTTLGPEPLPRNKPPGLLKYKQIGYLSLPFPKRLKINHFIALSHSMQNPQ